MATTTAILTLAFLIFLIIITPFNEVRSEAPKNNTHTAYIGKNQGIAETFYQNNSFFRCLSKQYCSPIPEGQPRKKFAVMLKDKKTELVLPAFLKCYSDGRAIVSLSEDVIGTANQIIKTNNPNCIDYSTLSPQPDAQAIKDTVSAVEKLGDYCPKEDRSCLQQVYELFEQDLKNTAKAIISHLPFQSPPTDTTKMGCLSNILSNFKNSIFSVLKTFLYDVPKKIWEIGTAAWDYFFDQEKKSSSAAFLSSIMSVEMATALSNWDLPTFYNLLRSNFFKTFGAIRQFYFELMGCGEWSGEPFYSECLKKMNFSCKTCENVSQFTCGLLGQLGAGVALGGMMGTINSVSNVLKAKMATTGKGLIATLIPGALQTAVKNNSLVQGLADLKNSAIVQGGIAKAKEISNLTDDLLYRMGLTVGPVTGVLRSMRDELKLILGMGDAFKNLVAGNPVTQLYHFSYQKGKKIAQQTISNTLVQKGIVGVEAALLKAKKYAYHLQNIWDFLETHLAKLQIMSDPKKFNLVTFQKITQDYLKKVQDELEQIGFKVKATEDGQGLLLEKGGESVVYRPDFEIIKTRQFKNVEELKGRIKTHDGILHDDRDPNVVASSPAMIQDVLDSAKSSMGLFAATADGLDGLVYLAHLGVLPSKSRQPPRCTDILLDAQLLGVEDISEAAKEGPKTSASNLTPISNPKPNPNPSSSSGPLIPSPQVQSATPVSPPPQG